MSITITTNNVPRCTVDASELTEAERADFDYLDWAAIENGEDSATFVRYRGVTYPLNDFSADWGITRGTGLPEAFSGWNGFLADTMNSGVLIRYTSDPDGESVVLGTFYVS